MIGLIITDSLGLPRREIDREKTWVYRYLSQSDDINYTYLRRGGTTKDLKDAMVHYDYLFPDYIVIQMGICDCTRRVKPRILHGMRRRFKGGDFLNALIYNIVGWYIMTFTKIFKFRDVAPEKFKRNIVEFINFFKDKNDNVKIYLSVIADPGEKLCKKVYGIKQDVLMYNQLLQDICNENENIFLVNPYIGHKADEYVLETDGHHLNLYGNELFFNEITRMI